MTKVAILIDGAYLLKRLPSLYPAYRPKDPETTKAEAAANAIKELTFKHLEHQNKTIRVSKSMSLLYRVFYYDAEPYGNSEHRPITGKVIHYRKTAEAKFRSELFNQLRRKPNTAVRLGKVRRERGWVLKEAPHKELLSRKITVDDLTDDYFSLVLKQKASEINALEDRWEGIVELLGSENLPEFLRVFWNSRNKLARKVDLFKTMRSAIRDRASAFQLVHDMDKHARVYADLRSPEVDSWTAGERAGLLRLQMFNVRQPLALLLAAFERFGERDRAGFEQFLRAIVVISFRYNVICGHKSNDQEVVYNRIACQLSSTEACSVRDAIAGLRSVYPGDAEFKAAFADKVLRTTSARNYKVVHFILFQLEAHLSERDFESASVKYSIEHVLPKNPGDNGYDFNEQQREAFTYRLGNMTLLTTTDNRKLANAGYAEKRSVYKKSGFATTRRLAENFDVWTVEQVRAHQSWMAKQATAIWRISQFHDAE